MAGIAEMKRLPQLPTTEQAIDILASKDDVVGEQLYVFTENEIWRLKKFEPKTLGITLTIAYKWIKVW